MPTIALLGTLDTKGDEVAFIRDEIQRLGHRTLVIDVGTGGLPRIQPDVSREEVAITGGLDLPALTARADRGECVGAMAASAAAWAQQAYRDGRFDAILSLGGGGGTAIGSAAMQALPMLVPKLLISTLAGGNTAPYVGIKDITMMPSIVDICGLNRFSRKIFSQAAAAICGMSEVAATRDDSSDRPLIAASMFGNTTGCVEAAKDSLQEAGYEVLVFHATGTGGRTMEALIESGMIAGVLDVTTTELADELAGGVLSAGPHRLDAAGVAGVPAVVVPGCLDMVNFGRTETIPARYANRKFYIHNPQVTLMRTDAQESAALGRILAEKVNRYRGPVSVLIPRGGVSIISAPGGPFHDPAADAALFAAIAENLRPDIPLITLGCNINDPVFAKACVDALLANLAAEQKR